MSKDNEYINQVLQQHHIKQVKSTFITLHPNGEVEFQFKGKTIVLPALADWFTRQIHLRKPVIYSWKMK